MSNETFLLGVLAIAGVVLIVCAVIHWVQVRRELAKEELASLAPEAAVLDSAATTLSEIKPVVDPLCTEMSAAETALAAADANLLKCDTDGPNKGIAWPVLLATVELAERRFDRAQAGVTAHEHELDELRISLRGSSERLWNAYSGMRTGTGRDECSKLRSRRVDLEYELPRVPHIDWLPVKDKTLPEDIVARAKARKAARDAAEEARRNSCSSASCNTLYG